jgi:hypothetical protein
MRGGGWRERDRKAPFPLLSSLLTWYRNRLPHAQVPMPMGPMVRPGASVRRRATGREEEEEDGGHRLPRLGRAGGAGGAGRAFARLAGPARPPRPRPAGASRLVDGRVAWVPGRGVGIWTGWTTRARARERERASRREWWVWREEKRERSSTQAPPPPALAFARGRVGKGVVGPSTCNLTRLGAPLAACQHRRPGRVRLGGVKKRNMRRFKKNQSPPSHFHSPSLPSPTPSPLLPHTPMFSRALILALAMGA